VPRPKTFSDLGTSRRRLLLAFREGRSEIGCAMSGHSQPRRSSVRQAVGVTGSEGSPDTEKPGARDRSLPSDTGNHLDEILEDTQSPDGAAEGARRRYLLRRFWRSATGFWGRRSYSAWPLSGAVLLIILLNLGTLYAMNLWNRGFFDALDKRNTQQVFDLAL